ncbi:hypothetical protein CPL28_25035 [Salmonella enterica]|nr:hypothetical protein [Salmonella enterica]EAW3956582.1 hypothetical protein [Salmonella enterica subsp. enterica]EDC0987236.1 hypothetical protein [Salmonella enterica subsp. enterica serovar Give]EEK0870662.1 hypothetical protein [Salmonella enterica subsp. enterica serovar Dublin]EAW8461928.1 hypothetical protein [Salmonella enterica]
MPNQPALPQSSILLPETACDCVLCGFSSPQCASEPLIFVTPHGIAGVSLDIDNYCTVSLFFEQAYL